MNTDLWIVFGLNKAGAMVILGSFEAEFDPLPGLTEVLEKEDLTRWDFLYTLRVSPERAVALQGVATTPQLSTVIDQIGQFKSAAAGVAAGERLGR